MPSIPVTVRLEGLDADNHQLPAFDGFESMGGIAQAIALTTNYVETGKIRRRGQFEGRNIVKAFIPERGSVNFPLLVELSQNPAITAVVGPLAVGLIGNFFYDVLKHVIRRNVGTDITSDTDAMKVLEEDRVGDLEALSSAIEPALKRGHQIINTGANSIIINGGVNNISTFTPKTKEYINLTVNDKEVIEKDVSVASFNANSGYGRVYDRDLGRTVPILLTEETFATARPVLGWGLNEYSKGTGKKISLKYRRTLAWDGTPKRYIVLDAEIPAD